MLREFVVKTPLLAMPIFSFLLFGAIFVLVLALTFKKRSGAFDPVARLPLSEGDAVVEEVADGHR